MGWVLQNGKRLSNVVLPSAIPGILTGGILALSRAIGETAPLIVIGDSSYCSILTDRYI